MSSSGGNSVSARLIFTASGVQSLIQDKGRFGYLEFGIPLCGSLVPEWMELGNALVGNPADTPGLDFRILGPSLKVENGPVKIAVCGDVSVEVHSRTDAGMSFRKLSGWRSFTMNNGDEARIGSPEGTAGGFVAISGGIDIPAEFGSMSTYVRSEIGGLKGRALQVGDCLALGEKANELGSQPDRVLPSPPTDKNNSIRVVLGPQDDFFEPASLNDFLNENYTVSQAIDRMGARLDGKPLKHVGDSEIVSDGVVPGSIQVPGNGQPIVLLNDGQTVGGYPKIATIISSDLAQIGNAKPGDCFNFEVVSAKEACMIARKAKETLENLKRSIVAASANGFVDQKALYESNLVGGVVDMANPEHIEG